MTRRTAALAAAGRTWLASQGGGAVGTTAAVTHGDQLTALHTGPWAPQGVAQGSESLTAVSVPPGGRGYYEYGTPSEYTLTSAWPSNANDSNPSVLNDPDLLGGVVTGSPVTIDGYSIPVGAYICQWGDFPDGFDFSATAGTKVLFRGCRFRFSSGVGGPGLFNNNAAPSSQNILLHYCDIGLESLDPPSGEGLMHIKLIGGQNHRLLRNYHTRSSTFLQPNVAGCVIVENWIDEGIYAYGENGPSGGGDFLHLNGSSTEGGLSTLYILRNRIVFPSPDGSAGSTGSGSGQIGYGTQPGQTGYGTGTAPGRVVPQTDCVALFTSNGTQWLSSDVQVRDNYLGGSGYPIYAESSAGQQTNVKITGNKVTTRWWTNGGQKGQISWGNGVAISDGVNGCELSGNTWADDYGTGGNGATLTADRQYPAGNGPRAGATVF